MDSRKLYLKLSHTEVTPMYITRDIENTIFLKWLTSNDTRPLLVHGARQIGKTEAVKHFAKKHFKNIYYINLSYDKTINFIDSKDAIIIIDEMQISPNIILSINLLHSKLVLISSHKIKLPINIYDAYMTGFTFREFLMASNNHALIDTIETHISSLTPFSNEVHKQLLELFSTYLTLGGYPEIITSYLNGCNPYPILNIILDNIFKEAISICKGVSYRIFLQRVRYGLPCFIQNHEETFDTPTANLINLLQKTYIFTSIHNYQSPEKKHIYLMDTGIANVFLESEQITLESYMCSNLPKPVTYLNNNTFLYQRTAIEVNTTSIKPSKEIDFIIRTGTDNISKESNILTIPLYAFPFLKFT